MDEVTNLIMTEPRVLVSSCFTQVSRFRFRFITTICCCLLNGHLADCYSQIASAIIGPLYLHQRSKVRDTVVQWNSNSDMWLRRTSLLASLKVTL